MQPTSGTRATNPVALFTPTTGYILESKGVSPSKSALLDYQTHSEPIVDVDGTGDQTSNTEELKLHGNFDMVLINKGLAGETLKGMVVVWTVNRLVFGFSYCRH